MECLCARERGAKEKLWEKKHLEEIENDGVSIEAFGHLGEEDSTGAASK